VRPPSKSLLAVPALLAAALAFAPALVPGGATAAAKKPPGLTVVSLRSSAPEQAEPGRRFSIRGVVHSGRRRSATPALVSVTLRRSAHGRNVHAVGAARIARVRPGRRRAFRLVARAPSLPTGVSSRRFVIVACVRSRRGARASCRRVRRSLLVVAPAGGGGQPGGGAPGTGPGTTPGTGGEPGTAFAPGARSAGDRLFPAIGNGGYDATHYDLDVRYESESKPLGGRATIEATATQDLSEYSLDLHEMTASAVTVDGRTARFRQEPGKLIVTPPAGIARGSAFTTTVDYVGPVAAYIDPDGSSEGWVPTSDGAFVVNEPVGAMSWFPNDDVPSDKASYDIRVTVPGSREVLANGRVVSNTANADGTRTWHWREDAPMASYLVTATNGEFDVTEATTADPAIPTYYAVDSSYNAAQKTAMLDRLGQTPSILSFYESFLSTPYPFEAAGGVVDKSSVGYALETQTKPMYANNSSADPSSPSVDTISHELAHQWFGDSVSPATWSDIWLNEGPAEFLSWLWLERTGNSPLTTKQRFDTNYANPAMSWDVPPAQPPTAADLFDTDAMYTRGAMVLEALREIMGEPKFAGVLAAYQARFRYGNASTAQFIALVEDESGLDRARLDAFFRQWLYESGRPAITPDNF
jgi:aminopeptidase N